MTFLKDYGYDHARKSRSTSLHLIFGVALSWRHSKRKSDRMGTADNIDFGQWPGCVFPKPVSLQTGRLKVKDSSEEMDSSFTPKFQPRSSIPEMSHRLIFM